MRTWRWTERARNIGDLLLITFIIACCALVLILGITIGEHNHCEWAKAHHVQDGCPR